MGVQGRGKKSEIEQLREQVREMRMEMNELKRATQTQADAEVYCSDAEDGAAAAAGSLRPQNVAAHRRGRRRRAPTESDDDEEIPEYELPLLSHVHLGEDC
jgi:hypothetical protein